MKRFLTDKEIGERLRSARIAKDLTQTDLAKILGVGQTAVGKWERGTVINIKRSMIHQIALALDISPLIIIGIQPEESLAEQITLSSHESNIIKKYRALDERGKQAVDDTLEREYEFVKPKAEESAIS